MTLRQSFLTDIHNCNLQRYFTDYIAQTDLLCYYSTCHVIFIILLIEFIVRWSFTRIGMAILSKFNHAICDNFICRLRILPELSYSLHYFIYSIVLIWNIIWVVYLSPTYCSDYPIRCDITWIISPVALFHISDHYNLSYHLREFYR